MILKEEIMQKELSIVIAEVNVIRNALDEAFSELETQKEIMKEKLQSGSDIATVRLSNDFINACANKIKLLEMDLLKAEKKLSEARDRLLDAVKNRKAIETLKNKDHKEHLFKIMKEEQKFIDEIATQRARYREGILQTL